MAEAEARATLAIDLVDNVSPAAGSAARELQELQSQIAKDTKALAELNKTMRQLKAAANPDVEAINRLEKSMGTLKERISQSQANVVKLGGPLRRSASDSGRFKSKLEELGKAASVIPGPIGNLVGMLSKWASAGGLAKIATMALAGAVLALGVAGVKAAKGLADFAIASQNARRNELLMLESSTKLRTGIAYTYGLAGDKASDLQAAVDKVSASVSISREKVAGYAASLEKMGVRGKNILPALQAVSTAASGFGEEQANATASWAAALSVTGGNVQKLADRVNNQIGGVVRRQMLSAEVQALKLAESQAALFAGIDIEPLLKARKGFNDLFSQATNSGQALRRLLGTLVQPLVDGLAWLARATKIAMQEMIIAILKLENAWLDFRLYLKNGTDGGARALRAFRDTFELAFKDIRAVLDWFLDVLGGEWKEVVTAAAAVLGVTLVPVLWSAAAAAASFAAGVVVAAAPIVAAVAGVWLLIKAIQALWEIWTADDAATAAVKLVDGLVAGLASAGGKFVDAVVELAKSGMKAFTSLFGISSPSKVMAGYGKDIGAGLELGIDASAPAADNAMQGITAPPTAAGGGRGNSVSIGAINVTVGGSSGNAADTGRQVAGAIKRELEAILDVVAVQMGAPAS